MAGAAAEPAPMNAVRWRRRRGGEKKMKSILMAAAVVGALLAGASSASATMLKITFTGDSESINDFQNVFGLGAEAVGDNANITNAAFVETFYLNTDGANAANGPTFVSNSPFFGVNPPYVLGASLTINGHTFSTLGSNGSYLAITSSTNPFTNVTTGDYYGDSNDVVPNAPRSNNDISFDIHSNAGAPLPSTVTQPITLRLNSTDYEIFDSFGDGNSGGEFFDAAGTLAPDLLTITPVSAAPEPAAWTLMIAGVAVLGAALRRRGGWSASAA
jgi:hypothetical protein